MKNKSPAHYEKISMLVTLVNALKLDLAEVEKMFAASLE
jgi:hypothetical protein